MLTLLLAGLVVAIAYLFWYQPNQRCRDLVNRFPGPKPRPLIGNMHHVLFGHGWYKRLLGWSETYRRKGVFRFWMFRMPFFFVFDNKYNEVIMSNTKYINKSPNYDRLKPWLRTGLLTSNGDKWHVRRKMLTPAFHFNILNDFVHVFNKQADVLVQKLEYKANQGIFNLLPEFQLCTLDIICETAMGKTIEAQKRADSEYVKAVGRLGKLIVERVRQPYYRSDTIYNYFGPGEEFKTCLKTVHEFTKSVIADRLKDFDMHKAEICLKEQTDGEAVGPKKTRMAFLDRLIYISENLTKLSFEDIQEEVDTFMFEGHDTTSSALSFAAYLIASHPEVQAKVQEELDCVLGSQARDITVEDIRELKYLECCIKEAMRIFPPVPYISRLLHEDLNVDDDIFPKGSTMVMLTISLHRDPVVFPDPEKFDPNRFLLENSKHRNPYSFVPFSAGPRNCIGQKFAMMEEKVVLAHLFRALTLKPTQTREELRPMMELVLKPEEGIFVELKKR